jgi:hypothetical protein
LSFVSDFGWAGRNSFLVSFVHAARKTRIGSFIRAVDMAVLRGLFKARRPLFREMMNKSGISRRIPPMDKVQ